MSNDLLNLLMEIRSRARSQKDWTTADFIRDELKRSGSSLRIPLMARVGRRRAVYESHLFMDRHHQFSFFDFSLYWRRRL